MATLTENERHQLQRLEAAVEAGVKAALVMIDAGKALAEIKARQLYRDTSATWEKYVSDRFRISPRRADQLVQFAGVSETIKAVSSEIGTAVPVLGERAVRPLVGLAPETVAEVIAEAAGTPAGVTPATIRKAAAKRKATKAKVRRPVRVKVPGAVVMISWNRKASGTAVEALEAAIRQLRAAETEAA